MKKLGDNPVHERSPAGTRARSRRRRPRAGLVSAARARSTGLAPCACACAALLAHAEAGSAEAPPRLAAEDTAAGAPENAGSDAALGSIRLQIVDASSREPLREATAAIPAEGREATADEAGEIEFDDLPPGALALEISRAGYADKTTEVEISAAETAEREIALGPASVEVDGEVITVIGRNGGLSEVYHPQTELSGDELQRHLASSVPETLESVPGFSLEYMGPSATSPSIRGMEGDRVLMLEDGHRTGDIYWTASDHGVMVEPISAKRMEVLRGPAGLLYGSNALGGVVNVIRDDIPTRRPPELEGTLVSQFESVNRGFSSGAVARGPAGPLAWYGEIAGRSARDIRTPAGPLEQTDTRVMNLAAGTSWDADWGLVGGAARYYDNAYGVPGEFEGERLPGGHPGGVAIEARRLASRFLAAAEHPPGPIDHLELRSNLTRYLHDEIEGELEGEEVIGAAFDQTSTDSRLVAQRHPHPIAGREDLTLSGAVGLSLNTRHLAAGGANPGTRSGRELSAGAFGYSELERSPFRLVGGLRYDRAHVSTPTESDIEVRTDDRDIVKPVSPRSFGAASASLAALFDATERWTVGINAARSYRHPRIEELFSDGPHLADFSFDIGSPDLEPEVGHGLDVFARASGPGLSLEIAGYVNRVRNYIYYAPTGETVPVITEGFPTRDTPVFEAQGDDALFVGAEGQVEWEVIEDVVLDVTASYTRAERSERGDPLPYIPPLSGRVEARYEGSSFFGSVGADLGAPQNRVPRPIEVGGTEERPVEPTSGYALFNLGLGWRHEGDLADHTVMLQAENVTDRVWRDHLSRIKEVAPQPGRNFQLSYRALL